MSLTITFFNQCRDFSLKSQVGASVINVGQSVRRKEDLRFITGSSIYIDDVDLPKTVHCTFVRSPYPHARLGRISAQDALSLGGVVAVLSHQDLSKFARPLVPILSDNYRPMKIGHLASDKVRFEGEPVAMVVASDRYIAEDAAELVQVEYEQLAPITNVERGIADGAPLVYEEWGDNVFFRKKFATANIDKAFSKADRVIGETFRSHRYMAAPIETRGCLASYDPGTRILSYWMSRQDVHIDRFLISEALGIPESRVRVIAPEIGGAFGLKHGTYPEDVAIAAASMLLGRPVKWIETRSEHMKAAAHAREQVHHTEVAFRNDGIILGLKDRAYGDFGSGLLYPNHAGTVMGVTAMHLVGPYAIRDYAFELYGVVTNKSPQGAYRGFGRPEAVFVIERLVDTIARELHLDPVEIRLKNMVKEFPFVAATGEIWDSGDYTDLLGKAVALAGYHELRARQERRRSEGALFGIGIACNVESTAPMVFPNKGRWSGNEAATVRVEPDGRVSVFSGLTSLGTGLETIIAQVVSDEFRLPMDWVSVFLGDTGTTPFSNGVWGSRGAVTGGSAALAAAKKLKEKMFKIAEHLLDTEINDLEMEDGRITVRGDHSRSLSFQDIAQVAYNETFRLPESMEPGLSQTSFYTPPDIMKVPAPVASAAHIAALEVDKDTGTVKLVKYVAVHDDGRIINPSIVEGQLVGGIAQSIGGALLEELIYDENGQLQTSTFADYMIPCSTDIPKIEIGHLEIPATNVPGGIKGCGEAGTASPVAAIANAIQDALSSYDVKITSTPLTPETLWRMTH